MNAVKSKICICRLFFLLFCTIRVDYGVKLATCLEDETGLEHIQFAVASSMATLNKSASFLRCTKFREENLLEIFS